MEVAVAVAMEVAAGSVCAAYADGVDGGCAACEDGAGGGDDEGGDNDSRGESK